MTEYPYPFIDSVEIAVGIRIDVGSSRRGAFALLNLINDKETNSDENNSHALIDPKDCM
jgi:hypothetical protein